MPATLWKVVVEPFFSLLSLIVVFCHSRIISFYSRSYSYCCFLARILVFFVFVVNLVFVVPFVVDVFYSCSYFCIVLVLIVVGNPVF